MRIGLPEELTALEPVALLQRGLDRAIQGAEWVLRGALRGTLPAIPGPGRLPPHQEAGPGAVLLRTARWIDRGIEMIRLGGKSEVEEVERFAGRPG